MEFFLHLKLFKSKYSFEGKPFPMNWQRFLLIVMRAVDCKLLDNIIYLQLLNSFISILLWSLLFVWQKIVESVNITLWQIKLFVPSGVTNTKGQKFSTIKMKRMYTKYTEEEVSELEPFCMKSTKNTNICASLAGFEMYS